MIYMDRKRFSRSLLGIVSLALLAGCSDDLDAQQRTLDRFADRNQIGSSEDYWLEMLNLAGEWERVALVYGYYDDFSGCSDIARLLMSDYDRVYRCIPAN